MSLVRGDALSLPLADGSVDLIVTSPPYFALRSYTDACPECDGTGQRERPASHGMKVCPDCGNVANRKRCNLCDASMKWPPKPGAAREACPACDGRGGEHYPGQVGSEDTPQQFLEALWAATREMVRVLKPSGSIWVNLGDKYQSTAPGTWNHGREISAGGRNGGRSATPEATFRPDLGVRPKSLCGLPWRYALGCIDQLGLILRAEVIWSKPNGLPESVTDRVRRSHEQWFHLTREPRYFSAVDEIREPHAAPIHAPGNAKWAAERNDGDRVTAAWGDAALGKLPGSVWTVPTEPLRVPEGLPQHFAAFPSEFPRRIILGWSPSGVCRECGEGRRPEVAKEANGTPRTDHGMGARHTDGAAVFDAGNRTASARSEWAENVTATITGYSCACPTPDAPTRPAVVLDPFCGTGTVPAVADALGRHGIGVDLSADYLRLARWRCADPGLRAKALGVDKPPREVPGQISLLDTA